MAHELDRTYWQGIEDKAVRLLKAYAISIATDLQDDKGLVYGEEESNPADTILIAVDAEERGVLEVMRVIAPKQRERIIREARKAMKQIEGAGR